MQVAFIYPTKDSDVAAAKRQKQNIALASFQANTPQTTGALWGTESANTNNTGDRLNDAANTTADFGSFSNSAVRQPSGSLANPSPARMGNSIKPQAPFVVLSRSLEAVIRNTGGEAAVHALAVQGDFKVQRQQLSSSSPWLFEVRGERFRLQRTPEDLANVHLVGAPASIALGSGWIVAPEFSFSQTEHAFWIDHPGELLLPQEAIPLSGFVGSLSPPPASSLVSTSGSDVSRASSSLPLMPTLAPSSPVRWLEAPRLKWGDRMVFDGKKAMFGGNISLYCKIETSPNVHWHVALHAGTMGI
jgi:hypothetical protein